MQAPKLSHYLQDIKRNLTKCKNNDHPFIFFDNEPTLDIVIVKKYYNDLEIDVNSRPDIHSDLFMYRGPIGLSRPRIDVNLYKDLQIIVS